MVLSERPRSGIGWMVLFVAACGAQTRHAAPDPTESGETRTPPEAGSRLDRARVARRAARTRLAPAPPANLDRLSALAYINGPLRDWIVARRGLSEVAAKAYAEAATSVSAEHAVALLEAGELWQAFGEEFTSAIRASVPREFAIDPQMNAVYLESALAAAQPVFANAYRAFQQCLEAAGRFGRDDTAHTCAERMARLPKIENAPPEGTSNAPDESGASSSAESEPKRAIPPPRKVAPSRPTPCEFAGSLEPGRQFTVWSDASAHRPAARLPRLDVSRLSLPESRGAAIRVAANWPLQGTYWIDAATSAIVLRERQELVQGHVWLDAGTPIHAHRDGARNAAVERTPDWTAGSEPTFSRSLPCQALALAGSVEHAQGGPDRSPVSFQGLLELSASPGGASIATLRLSKAASFEVLAERRPWRRVAARSEDWDLPFSFDAWTKAAPGGEPRFGMIGLLDSVNPSHVSIAALPLFAGPDAPSACATLAPNVGLRVGKASAGFVAIVSTDLWGPDQRELWIKDSALATKTRALAAP